MGCERRGAAGGVKYKEESDDRDLMESDEEAGLPYADQGAEQQKCAIDKILGYEERPDPAGGEFPLPFYLIKWREKSYTKSEWVSEERLLKEGGKQRVKNFLGRWWDHMRWDVDERGGEYFDPSYTEVERVVVSQDGEDGEEVFLVK
ncbi:hypothetical protein T484DRAFT_1834940 [Baffinella frigidus]|nr:hypothetical protein T484DRAFT_1834940 [Cryptophyta sp. CCMP2293]